MSEPRDYLAEAIAREIHQTWCDLPGHSYGDQDYPEAQKIAARVRRSIRKAAD